MSVLCLNLKISLFLRERKSSLETVGKVKKSERTTKDVVVGNAHCIGVRHYMTETQL